MRSVFRLLNFVRIIRQALGRILFDFFDVHGHKTNRHRQIDQMEQHPDLHAGKHGQFGDAVRDADGEHVAPAHIEPGIGTQIDHPEADHLVISQCLRQHQPDRHQRNHRIRKNPRGAADRHDGHDDAHRIEFLAFQPLDHLGQPHPDRAGLFERGNSGADEEHHENHHGRLLPALGYRLEDLPKSLRVGFDQMIGSGDDLGDRALFDAGELARRDDPGQDGHKNCDDKH